jgi:hypothetical protein
MDDKISGNVIQIHDYAGVGKKSVPSDSSRLLQDCRNTLLERTAEALSRSMDNIDDALFALADKAGDSTLQRHYFDAIRENRTIRKDIEGLFKERLKEEPAANKFSSQPQSPGPSLTDIGLSLVEDKDLEESQAIDTLAELEKQLESHQSHLDENIEAAKKLMEGRERLKTAESTTVEEIERRLEDKPFPQFIRAFAMENWKTLLIVTHMKEGQESDSWKGRLEMLDLLIWSTLPKPTPKDRKKLVEILPTLLSRLEEGMKLMSMSATEQDQFMEKLSGCHARLVNSGAQIMDVKDTKPAMNTISKSNVPVDAHKTQDDEPAMTERKPRQIGSFMVQEVRILGQELQPSLDNLRQGPEERLDIRLNLFDEDSVGGVDAPGRESAQEGEQEALTPEGRIEDEWTELVRNMVPGIWFEFHQEDGGNSMERLAWISSVLGSYLFTNHDGLKTRELSAQELEDGLRSGHAVLADDLNFLVDSSYHKLLEDMQKKITG